MLNEGKEILALTIEQDKKFADAVLFECKTT